MIKHIFPESGNGNSVDLGGRERVGEGGGEGEGEGEGRGRVGLLSLLPVSALSTYLTADLFTEPHCLTLHAPGKGGSLNPKGEGGAQPERRGVRGSCVAVQAVQNRKGKPSETVITLFPGTVCVPTAVHMHVLVYVNL
jgi:hypothetical protein